MVFKICEGIWCSSFCVKVSEDDIAFKLALLKKSLHLNDNTIFCSIIQSSKLFLGSLLAKNNFFVQFWTKNFAFSRMANCGSGLAAEWPFRSQIAIEASDSPLPGGLWVKHLITHALCSLAYSDITWCKLFLIFTMKCLFWVFFAYKTPYSVLIDNSIHIQEIGTEITWLTLQGQIFRCIKHLSVSQLKYLYIVSVKYFRYNSLCVLLPPLQAAILCVNIQASWSSYQYSFGLLTLVLFLPCFEPWVGPGTKIDFFVFDFLRFW